MGNISTDPLSYLFAATVFSIAFAFVSAWLLRVAPAAELAAYQLDDVSMAYLFGGRPRAQEVALYSLLRDGWITVDTTGVFSARFVDAPAEMNAVEREILKRIAEGGGLTVFDVAKLELKSIADVERRLLRKHLILNFHRLPLYNLMSRAPLGVSILFAVKIGGENYIRHETFIGPLIVAVVAWMSVGFLRERFSLRTSAGERLYGHLRNEISSRTRARNETDANGHGYDRLWNLRDDVLTKGFRSFIGSAILPSIVESQGARPRTAAPALSFERGVVVDSVKSDESAS